MKRREGEDAREKWYSSMMKMGLCVCVLRDTSRLWLCYHRRCLTAKGHSRSTSPIGPWASVSDPIGWRSDKRMAYSWRRLVVAADLATSPSHFWRFVRVCMQTSVWQAAVFANAFPLPPHPRVACARLCVKKEEKRRVTAFGCLLQSRHRWWSIH